MHQQRVPELRPPDGGVRRHAQQIYRRAESDFAFVYCG
jgi:hypothetical protein